MVEKAPEDERDWDRPFRHYSLKHRIVAWISTHLFGGVTYTVRRGLLAGMRRKGGLGWVPLSSGMSAEERFWLSLDLTGMTVYDVGAFEGLVTLFFASRAARVISFEPSARNRKRLTENLALNGVRNVEVRKTGVGARCEVRKLVMDPLMAGGASVEAKTAEEIARCGAAVAEEITIIALDEEIAHAGLPQPDLVKIDIEGWEIEALRGARATLEARRPALYLEMHGETIREKRRKVAEIVDFLWQIGYRDIRHVETGAAITPENAVAAMEGHLYCPRGAGGS